MFVDARNEIFEHIELFGDPAMFTNARVDRGSVPEGLFCYDVRGTDTDPGELYCIEPFVGVNHSGTVISAKNYMIEKGQAKYINDNINFLGDEVMLDEFCKLHHIEVGEPKRGVLDALKENKEKVAKQSVSSKPSNHQTR